MKTTPRQDLAEELLKGSGGVSKFVKSRRLRLKPMSWQAIADELAETTGGRVRVTGSAVRLWFLDELREEEAAISAPAEIGTEPDLFTTAGRAAS